MRTTPLLVLLAACASETSIEPRTGPGENDNPSGSCVTGPQVTVLGTYIARADGRPLNKANVHVASGEHVLVLSAYEPVDWNVTLAPGASVTRVHLVGYHAQTVNLDVPVTTNVFELGDDRYATGYVLPTDTQGGTPELLLALASRAVGSEVTAFHGCSEATDWTVHADGSATSNCTVKQHTSYFGCEAEPAEGFGDWHPLDFHLVIDHGDPNDDPCQGERYVRFDENYLMYVGAVLCDPTSYKLYVSESANSLFAELTDLDGDGADHCELVDPKFTLPDEADITSGGCTTCSLGPTSTVASVEIYARAAFGEPFQHRWYNDHPTSPTTLRYSCGVAIP